MTLRANTKKSLIEMSSTFYSTLNAFKTISKQKAFYHLYYLFTLSIFHLLESKFYFHHFIKFAPFVIVFFYIVVRTLLQLSLYIFRMRDFKNQVTKKKKTVVRIFKASYHGSINLKNLTIRPELKCL